MSLEKRIERIEKHLELDGMIETDLTGIGESEYFKIGQWYKTNATSSLCRYSGDGNGVGLNSVGGWTKHMEMTLPDYWKPATKDEIESRLIQEAKRRGFEKGVKIKFPNDIKLTAQSNDFDYVAHIDSLYIGNYRIYYNGQWAEIIETPIKINGVEFTGFDDGALVFDCGEEIKMHHAKIFNDIVELYDLEIYRKGENITPQIKQIGEQL